MCITSSLTSILSTWVLIHVNTVVNVYDRGIRFHMAAVDGYALDSSFLYLPAAVVLPRVVIVVLPVRHLLVGLGTMIHLQRIVYVEVFCIMNGDGV